MATNSTMLERRLAKGVVWLLWVLPVYGAFSVIGTHLLHHQGLWPGLRAVYIGLLGLGVLAVAMSRRRWPGGFDGLNWLLVAAAGLGVMVTLVGNVTTKAFIYGVELTLLPLGWFIITRALRSQVDLKRLADGLIVVGIVVASLAIIQQLIPPHWLQTLGYGNGSIADHIPLFIKGSYISSINRSFSTTNGPNQLGALLLIPLAILVGRLARMKKIQLNGQVVGLLIVLTGLVFSFSRVAWLGAAAVAMFVITRRLPAKRLKQLGIVVGVVFVGLSLGLAVVIVRPGTSRVEEIVLHGDVNGGIHGSDIGRFSAIRASFDKITARPLGYGLGAVGPASIYNHVSFISESWLLQLGLELGVIGFGLMLVWLWLAARRLWQARDRLSPDERMIALSLGFIMLASMFSLELADSGVGLMVFGLGGLLVGGVSS